MTSFVLDLFRAVFRRKKSISQIVSPMQKIVRDLEWHAAQQQKASAKHNAAAIRSADLSSAADRESDAAKNLARNYKGLIGEAA